MDTPQPPLRSDASTVPSWVTLVGERLAGLRYGVLQITVHDGRITQIDRTERLRLASAIEPPRESGS